MGEPNDVGCRRVVAAAGGVSDAVDAGDVITVVVGCWDPWDVSANGDAEGLAFVAAPLNAGSRSRLKRSWSRSPEDAMGIPLEAVGAAAMVGLGLLIVVVGLGDIVALAGDVVLDNVMGLTLNAELAGLLMPTEPDDGAGVGDADTAGGPAGAGWWSRNVVCAGDGDCGTA